MGCYSISCISQQSKYSSRAAGHIVPYLNLASKLQRHEYCAESMSLSKIALGAPMVRAFGQKKPWLPQPAKLQKKPNEQERHHSAVELSLVSLDDKPFRASLFQSCPVISLFDRICYNTLLQSNNRSLLLFKSQCSQLVIGGQ